MTARPETVEELSGRDIGALVEVNYLGKVMGGRGGPDVVNVVRAHLFGVHHVGRRIDVTRIGSAGREEISDYSEVVLDFDSGTVTVPRDARVRFVS